MPMIIEPFLTYEQLLDKLVNDKDLIINNVKLAEEELKECGYFNIIGGYKVPFINPSTRKYENNTTFGMICIYMEGEELKFTVKEAKEIAELSSKTKELSKEVNRYFIGKGFDIEKLRCGNGKNLE